MYRLFSALLCLCFFRVSLCDDTKELPIRYVSVRTIGTPILQRNAQNQPYYSPGQFLIKRDSARNPMLIQSDVKRLPSVKTSGLDELYNTKEFNELLNEYKLKIDKSKLPNVREIASLLGTHDAQETLEAIKDFASTSDGLDLIKSYLDYNVANDKIDVKTEPTASKFQGEYVTNAEEKDEGSWWHKFIPKWFSQSTKVESAKKDLDILSTVIPLTNSFENNARYVGNFLKPPSQMKIPINPPFKVFNSQSINLSNQPYTIDVKTLPTMRLTEHQYNELMKSVNLNSPKLAKYGATEKVEDNLNKDLPVNNQFETSDIKRSFNAHSQPIRHTSYDLPTRSLYKANPDDIDKISKILSTKIGM